MPILLVLFGLEGRLLQKEILDFFRNINETLAYKLVNSQTKASILLLWVTGAALLTVVQIRH